MTGQPTATPSADRTASWRTGPDRPAPPISGGADAAWEVLKALRQQAARRPARVAADLGLLFRNGAPPGRLDGEYAGLLLTTTQGPLDPTARILSRLWRPWTGKRFDAGAETGDNLLTPAGELVARVVWPGYRFAPAPAGRRSAFEFSTRREPGTADPDREVLKIDYDSEANPRRLIREVLDEVVEVAPGVYLGKVLMRRPAGWKVMGYFALRERGENGPDSTLAAGGRVSSAAPPARSIPRGYLRLGTPDLR